MKKILTTFLALNIVCALFGKDPSTVPLKIETEPYLEHWRKKGVLDLNLDGIDDMLLTGDMIYAPYGYSVYIGQEDGSYKFVGEIYSQAGRIAIDHFSDDRSSSPTVHRIWTWNHFSCCDGEVVEYRLKNGALEKGAKIYLGSWDELGEGASFKGKFLEAIFSESEKSKIKWYRSKEVGEVVTWVQD